MVRGLVDLLVEMFGEGLVVFKNPSYESAIIGVSESDRVVYSYDKMVEYLCSNDDMSEEEANDFINYNTIRALPYMENSPIIVFSI